MRKISGRLCATRPAGSPPDPARLNTASAIGQQYSAACLALGRCRPDADRTLHRAACREHAASGQLLPGLPRGSRLRFTTRSLSTTARRTCDVHFAPENGVRGRPNHKMIPPDMFDAYFWPDDADALHAELKDRGATIIQAPTDQPNGLRAPQRNIRRALGTETPARCRRRAVVRRSILIETASRLLVLALSASVTDRSFVRQRRETERSAHIRRTGVLRPLFEVTPAADGPSTPATIRQ